MKIKQSNHAGKDAHLDRPTRLPPEAGLGTTTRRQSMEMAFEQERCVKLVMIRDTDAKAKDHATLEQARWVESIPGLSKGETPRAMEFVDAEARIKADVYERPEYRVYTGSNDQGGFHVITESEYGYVQELKARSEVAYGVLRAELAKSWDRQFLDASGAPLPVYKDDTPPAAPVRTRSRPSM